MRQLSTDISGKVICVQRNLYKYNLFQNRRVDSYDTYGRFMGLAQKKNINVSYKPRMRS